jgi:hypothetical protein
MGADGKDIDVGDTVDVPGGMVGVVKFVGSIRGKQGVFAGVELNREYAARGKNDGAVDGYAHTTLDTCARILMILQYAVLRYVRSRLWYLPARTSRSETGLSGLVRLRTRAYHAFIP